MSIIKGQMEVETGDVLYPKTSIDMIEGNNQLLVKQLLINNDFQVNQRGQSVYSPSEVKYTLDMWIKWGAEIRVTSNGIIFDTVGNESNGALGQKVESIEVGKKYTACINITSIKGSGTMSIGTRTEFDNVAHNNSLKQGINKITFTATGKWLTLCCKNVEIDIEYIDLFEGDIAYHHVKEDYQQALLRCLYYVEYGEFACHYNNNTYFIPGFTYKYPKRDAPTIEFIKTVVDEQGSVSGTFTAVSQNACSCPFVRYNNGSAVGLGIKVLNMRVLISCEPL